MNKIYPLRETPERPITEIYKFFEEQNVWSEETIIDFVANHCRSDFLTRKYKDFDSRKKKLVQFLKNRERRKKLTKLNKNFFN